MRSYLGLVFRYGHQHFRHSVPDIVPYDIPDKKHRKEHSDTRIYEIQEIIVETVEPGGERMVDMSYGKLESYRRQTACHSDQKGKYKKKVMLRKPFPDPCEETVPEGDLHYLAVFGHQWS